MIPVILSGGSGSRLWPVSRASFPKQFCDLLDESLFAKTVKRLAPLGSPWVVTVEEMKNLTLKGLKDLNVSADQVIYEPFGKNTAPAMALLCRRFELLGLADEVVGIFPADHLIDDDDEFRTVVCQGEELAARGYVVTLGIVPTYPATGYGYIATSGPVVAKGALTDSADGALNAVGFREKPNEETARDFLARGDFFWNAGMFIFRVRTMIELFTMYAPDIWQTISSLRQDLSNINAVYSAVRATSIDYAIMERLPGHACIPCKFGWSDLGSWDSIATVTKGESSPCARKVEAEGSGNFVFSRTARTYAFAGVEDLVIVDTPDALLVTRKGKTELVKQLVEELKSRDIPGAG